MERYQEYIKRYKENIKNNTKKEISGLLGPYTKIAMLISISCHIFLAIAGTLYFISRLGLIGILLLFIFGPGAPLFPVVYWILEGVFPGDYFVIVGIEGLSFVFVVIFYNISKEITGDEE